MPYGKPYVSDVSTPGHGIYSDRVKSYRLPMDDTFAIVDRDDIGEFHAIVDGTASSTNLTHDMEENSKLPTENLV